MTSWRWSQTCVELSRLASQSSCPGGLPAFADDTPKRGGILTFMIPADSPPSFDGHRENTFATVHAVAPFYSVLIRANPEDPGRDDRVRLRCLHRDTRAVGRGPDLRIPDPR